jgi:hypothetical protein
MARLTEWRRHSPDHRPAIAQLLQSRPAQLEVRARVAKLRVRLRRAHLRVLVKNVDAAKRERPYMRDVRESGRRR